MDTESVFEKRDRLVAATRHIPESLREVERSLSINLLIDHCIGKRLYNQSGQELGLIIGIEPMQINGTIYECFEVEPSEIYCGRFWQIDRLSRTRADWIAVR